MRTHGWQRVWLLVALAPVACGSKSPAELSAATSSNGQDAGKNGGSTPDDASGPSAALDAGTPRAPAADGASLDFDAADDGAAQDGANPNCPTGSSSIYTVAIDTGGLYRFDPPTLTFTLIGTLACPDTMGGAPGSMAVDRDGFAWVIYTDGSLFKVDVRTADCQPTSFVAGQDGFTEFGMGFSTNAPSGPGSTEETLFVADSQSNRLATISASTLALTPLGSYALAPFPELTGTGDARLFGLFPGTPFVIAQIDKTSLAILSQAPQSPIDTYANPNYAFAFWGGDFYVFVGSGGSGQTDVYHYQASTSGTTTKVQTGPFETVGAGVSTCAPTTPPM